MRIHGKISLHADSKMGPSITLRLFATFVLSIGAVNGETDHEGKQLNDAMNDKSVFDKILAINQAAASSGDSKAKLFEGDIIETDVVQMVKLARRNRGAINNPAKLWPLVHGYRQVPYIIYNSPYYSRSTILLAMQEWMDKVPCIKFVENTMNARDHLRFHSGAGCSSAVGRHDGGQWVSIGRNCGYHGIVVHEIGHALGFWHEQSRPDRDNYVTIFWNNINPNMAFNFYTNNGINSRGVPYDYNSIMHYGPMAFSNNGRHTILAKNGQLIGQRQGLSSSDALQANKMYGCHTTAGCTDSDSRCKFWADSKYCTSETYQTWMLKNCKRSCCQDKNSSCQYWASIGECEKNPYYMIPNCTKSCMKLECKC